MLIWRTEWHILRRPAPSAVTFARACQHTLSSVSALPSCRKVNVVFVPPEEDPPEDCEFWWTFGAAAGVIASEYMCFSGRVAW